MQNMVNPSQDNADDGGIFSKLGQYGDRRRALDVERNNEYNKQIAQVSLWKKYLRV